MLQVLITILKILWSGKEFADTVATEQILILNAGHINAESGYDKFEDIVKFL